MPNIRTKTTVLIILTVLTVFSVSYCVFGVAAAERIPAQSDTPIPVYYTLTVLDNRLAIYCSDNTKPLRILEVDVHSLPERDITRLNEGITADSLQEIMQLVEDYE